MDFVNHETIFPKKLTADYIRGLVEGEGCFTFSQNTNLQGKKIRIPAFSIKMAVRDKKLLEAVRDFMGVKNKVYIYNHQRKDGYKREPSATLIIREIGNLKNIVVPLFYDNLFGNKAIQFNQWLEKIDSDPDVPESFKIIHFLHKKGYYRKNPKTFS